MFNSDISEKKTNARFIDLQTGLVLYMCFNEFKIDFEIYNN